MNPTTMSASLSSCGLGRGYFQPPEPELPPRQWIPDGKQLGGASRDYRRGEEPRGSCVQAVWLLSRATDQGGAGSEAHSWHREPELAS